MIWKELSKRCQEDLMRVVMEEVKESIHEGCSPFAALLVSKNGEIIEKAYNTAKVVGNPILHAEMNLITKACKKLNTTDLSEYWLVSNAESCSMCMSACIKAKISHFIFGAPSELDMDPYITVFDIKNKTKKPLHIITGVLEEECKLQILNAREKSKEEKIWN